MSHDESFGQRVRQERRALDLTQEELARRVGCAAITIRKIEAGDLRPSQQIAERLAMALAIPLKDRAEFVQQARLVQPGGRLSEPTPTPQVMPDEIGLEDLSGRAIRGYQLGEKIGAGAFGAVYRGVQPLVEREVAIKIILPQYANHPDFIRRFEAEAQLVARLEHPHIVPLYDYWREPGVAYLVMRLLRGGSIHELIEHGPLPLDLTTHLLEQMCDALRAAHRAGVVHRDLKPSNVLLDEDHNAYLADFGIAKNLGAPEAQTQTDMVIGSPAYLSPEQALSEPVRPQTDIYSLGVMMYEMLTGVKPFTGPTPILLIQQHLYATMPPLAANREGLPAAFDEVIARATAKDPLQRYHEVDALLADFQEVLKSGRLAVPSIELASALWAAAPDGPIEIVNPYKGLHPFEEADAPDFFGREALTQQLLARLGEGGDLNRFLAVVGPSGCGKSSVVGAGLIPALRRGGLPHSENWFIVEVLPGPHPLEELEAALLRVAVNPPERLLAQIKEDQRGLLRAVQRALPADPNIELVLVLDQFEEVFTLVTDEAERLHLLDSLVATVLDERSRARVIVTLRADFIDKPLRYVDFGELMQRRSELVLPLTLDEMERAIVGPAERVGLHLESGLVESITSDVSDQPGALPLMQYALTELFERRVDHTLTKAAYHNLGGVKGALGRRAEEIYQSLDESQQALARQIFLRLVTLGEGVEDTRRRVLLTELESLSTKFTKTTKEEAENLSDLRILRGSEKISAVLDAFGKTRLLSFDRDLQTRGPTVEVAHEALLREWPRLREWLSESRSDVRLQRLLANEVAEWLSANRENSFLLHGSRLQQFEDWAKTMSVALTNDERAYLEASLAERERQRIAEEQRRTREVKLEHRAKRVLQGLVAVAVIAAIISGALALIAANREQEAQVQRQEALTQKQEAETQRQEAVDQKQEADTQRQEALTQKQEADSQRQEAETQRQEAEWQKQEALRQASIGLAAQALAELQGTSPERGVLLALGALKNYPYTPQAESALAKAVENGVTYSDYESHAGTANIQWEKGAWSPDGLQFAAVSKGKLGPRGVVWDTSTGEPISTFKSPGFANETACVMVDLDWNPGNDRLIIVNGSPYGEVCPDIQSPTIWNAKTGNAIRAFDIYTDAASADWSYDGLSIAIGDEQGTTKIWTVADGALRLNLPGHTGKVNDVSFSPTGEQLATASADRTARVWDLTSGQVITILANHAGSVTGLAWSPDGHQLATSSQDGLARIWDVAVGTIARTLPGHAASVNDIAWSASGDRIATISSDGTARLWNAATGTEISQIRSARTSTIDLSSLGDQVAIGGGDYESTYFRIWRILTSSTALVAPSGYYAEAQWSPDGKLIAATSGDARVWDSVTHLELQRLDRTEEEPPFGYFGWSPDSRYLAMRYGPKARIWDVNNGTVVTETTLTKDPGFVWATGWSSDGSRIASAIYPDFTVAIWDVSSSRVITTIGDGHCFMHYPDWSPQSERFVTGCLFTPDLKDNTPATIWDAEGNKVMELPSDNGESVRGEWSPDGTRIAVGYEDGTAKIWDATTGQEVLRLAASNGILIWQVAWSPDGRRVASVDTNGLLKVWDVGTGSEVMRFQVPGFTTSVDWSSDGKYLIAPADQVVIARVWQSTDELIQYAKECCVFRELTPEERQQFGLMP
jgi:WD40 repeat protein/transcriptional regulator with XRE-family HTH domain